MAHSAHTTVTQLTEVRDSPELMWKKVAQLARLIDQSRRVVFLTGAGMSTACGIRDYRSGADTCVETGMGTWTAKKLALEKVAASAALSAPPPPRQKRKKRKSWQAERKRSASKRVSAEIPLDDDEYDEQFEQSVLAATPSYAHLALKELHTIGKLHMLITQNTDGLHAMSGLPSSALAEVHGNSLLEECVRCSRVYHCDAFALNPSRHAGCNTAEIRRRRLRHLLEVDPAHPRVQELHADLELDEQDEESDAAESAGDPYSRHFTGRFCPEPSCRGELIDTVIEFGDSLFNDTLDKCKRAGEEADLLIVLGSSIVVDPVRSIVYSNLFKKVAVINLQLTAIEPHADVSIHGKIDDVMRMLMAELKLTVPQPFFMRRFVRIEQRRRGQHELELHVGGFAGMENGAATVDMLKEVQLSVPSKCARLDRRSTRRNCVPEPVFYEREHSVQPVTGAHTLVLRTVDGLPSTEIKGTCVLTLHFYGHKKEPPVALDIDLLLDQHTVLELRFDVSKRQWLPLPELHWSPLTQLITRSGRRVAHINHKE